MLQFKGRIESYRLSLNMDKTKMLNFNKSKENSLNFLGFTFDWDSFYRRLEFNPLPIPQSMNKLKKLGKTYGII